MSPKFVFGIFLPLGVVLGLVILSTLEIGFSVKTTTATSISIKDLNRTGHPISVQEIYIKNDFFLPRRYELPRYVACLLDEEGIQMKQTLNLRYSEIFDYLTETGSRISELSLSAQGFRPSIEVAAYRTKTVKLIFEPYYYLDNTKEYDEIVLLPIKGESYYNYCDYIDNNEAIHIPIKP